MDRWEYLIVESLGTDVRRADGKVLSQAAVCNELGQQGWELVSTSDVTAGRKIPVLQLFFKRRLDSAGA